MSNASEFEIADQVAYELCDVFAFHIIMSYLALTWLVSMSIQVIIDEVKNGAQLDQRSADQQLAKKWNRSYCLIFKLTKKIDNCFGSVLVYFIGRQFFLCFQNLFQIIMTFVYKESLSDCLYELSYIFNNTLLLLMIIYGAQRMKNKVS